LPEVLADLVTEVRSYLNALADMTIWTRIFISPHMSEIGECDNNSW
jgi:hypothetical protein